jgi:hypothetical protein
MARTTPPFRIGLVGIVLATAVGWTQTSQSLAASNLTVSVQAPTPGTLATTGPVVIGVHMTVAADQPGALPPQLRALGLRMPQGFSTAVATIPPCSDAHALATQGSSACATASKVGTGTASVLISDLKQTATTQELSIFRSTGDSILAYARIKGRPVVLPGILLWRVPDAPLLKLDLRKLEPAGIRVTSADIALTQGVQAGPCPTGSWTFKAQLEFVEAVPPPTTPSAPCAQSPAPPAPAPQAPASVPTALVLRASARTSPRASGAHLAFVLSAPATIKITLERRIAKRWIAVRRLSVHKRAGSSSLTIHTAHGRTLPAGRYRARLRAVDAAGAASAPQSVRFILG